MRTIMLWGGFAGFFLAAAAGLAAEKPLDLILRDAAIACLIGAWLLRWWWTRLECALTETMEIRRRLAEAEAEAEQAAAKNTSATKPSSTSSRRESANPAFSRSAPAAPTMPARP